jgi:hypothetical protein
MKCLKVPKILDTAARGPLDFEAIGFSLTMHIDKSDTGCISSVNTPLLNAIMIITSV